MNALASGPACQIFRGRRDGLSAAGRGRRQRHSRPSVRLEGSVARGRGTGRAGDRHRPAVLSRCCRSIASMIMGGLFKQSTNQMQAQAGGFGRRQSARRDHRADDAAGRGGMGGRSREPPASRPNPFDNPFGKVLQDMFGGGAQRGRNAAGAQQTQTRMATIRSARSSRTCWAAGQRAAGARAGGSRTRSRAPNPSGRPRNPYDDLFGNMFETGAQAARRLPEGHGIDLRSVHQGHGPAPISPASDEKMRRSRSAGPGRCRQAPVGGAGGERGTPAGRSRVASAGRAGRASLSLRRAAAPLRRAARSGRRRTAAEATCRSARVRPISASSASDISPSR